MTERKTSERFKVRVSGDLACFTRPEMKVERVSYETITPSAARNILQAILWKPAIEWRVHRIHVLKPVRWASFKRNEVTDKIATGSVNAAMKSGEPMEPFLADEKRAQRHTLALRDVDYVIEADFQLLPPPKSNPKEDTVTKFSEMFVRRLEKGQHYRMPYLGCREFAADVRLQTEPFQAIGETRDLGFMLHDIEFRPTGGNLPHFFRAKLENGVIDVPELQPGLQLSGGVK